MKKLLVLIMALVITLSVAACSGEKAAAPVQGSSGETSNIYAASDTEFVSMTFGYITMRVPSDFSAAQCR